MPCNSESWNQFWFFCLFYEHDELLIAEAFSVLLAEQVDSRLDVKYLSLEFILQGWQLYIYACILLNVWKEIVGFFGTRI